MSRWTRSSPIRDSWLGAAAIWIAVASCAPLPAPHIASGDTTAGLDPAPRPVYAVAHRANGKDAVVRALELGANALELDIRVHEGRFCANHDPVSPLVPCEPLVDLLAFIRRSQEDAARRGQASLGLVFYDFKSDGGMADAGRKLLDQIRQHLSDATGVHTLISIAQRTDHRLLDGAYDDLRSGEALAVDYEDDPEAVAEFFESRGVRGFAYATGCCVVCVCPGVERAIVEGIALRAEVRRLDLVYVWTLASESSLERYLGLGVDGIFVNGGWVIGTSNDIPRLLQLIDEDPGVRLAAADHNPFP